MSALEQVLALEQRRLSAMMKGDVDAVAACLDDDLIYVHSNGTIDSKESYLSALVAGQYVYESIDILETRHAAGTHLVVLCHVLSARIRLKSQSESVQRRLVASSTWRLSAGNWRLVSMQATAQPGAVP
jgi:ketosteroid isomerase-like protein